MNDSEGTNAAPPDTQILPRPLSPSAQTVLAALAARFPQTPFLALGQTALWDEPTKAVLRRALDTVCPQTVLLAGAHDTDYFAKLPGGGSISALSQHGQYALARHDDNKTRGLWSAAGEMSSLFGGEDVVSQEDLRAHGTLLFRALAPLEGEAERDRVLSELTAAWGWTGIIYTQWDRKIARDVALSDILPTLLTQVRLSVAESARCLGGSRSDNAVQIAETMCGWIKAFAKENAGASLTQLYADLLPRFYGWLLGTQTDVPTTCTSDLLCFNRETARLPRFALLDVFLNPITRPVARDAYNLAVGGSDIYTLDKFGKGAIPFDLVIPGKGRGTLCVPGDGTIFVDTPRQPIILCDTGCDFSDVDKLAALIERELGTDVSLVGKAVTLLPMLATEHIIVFHEGASGYTDRTQAMMARLAARKVALPPVCPILRIRHSTWDALEAVPLTGDKESDAFVLPPHLAQAFGRDALPIDEFASCWRHVLQTETQKLDAMKSVGSPRQLLRNLAAAPNGAQWEEKQKQYHAANYKLHALHDEADSIQGRVLTLYDQIRALKTEADTIERAKGDDFRARVLPLRVRMLRAEGEGGVGEAADLQAQINALQTERALAFNTEIASRRGQVRFALATIRELKASRLAIERGADSTAARQTLKIIEAEIELAHAKTVRNALQTLRGLPHTDFRPSAWWFPLVDPSGLWFARLCETAEFYLEPLDGKGEG